MQHEFVAFVFVCVRAPLVDDGYSGFPADHSLSVASAFNGIASTFL
jgi:hypothetical protein